MNTYNITVIECFTRELTIEAPNQTTAETFAKLLYNNGLMVDNEPKLDDVIIIAEHII